jgi:glycosyltransferase involved in cell wall biosynthesis
MSLGIKPELIFVAPNAVASRQSFTLSNKSSQYPEPSRVLYVGRLQERKRIDHLIYACSQVKPELQPDLMIVGDGPSRQELENLAEKIYPRTIFTGERYGNDLKQLFEQADLFVLPGTGGLAVQEAMSYGLPVIVAEGDGTQNDIVRPNNGWIIPSGDLEALAHSLAEALQNPVRLRAMGLESYRIVAEEVNIENMVNVFITAIKSVSQ